jgi:predicted RNA-binding protein YlqC (UPF0109 family)
MSNIDQDFVEFIVKSLVGKPEEVKIERRIDEKGVLIELTVDPEDLGRIIGKRGATAQSLRTLLRALGTKNDARYNLKIVDNGPEDYRPSRNDAAPAESAPVSDNTPSDEPAVDEEPIEEPAAKSTASADVELDDDIEDESDSDSRAAKTRRELEDLDDLDI